MNKLIIILLTSCVITHAYGMKKITREIGTETDAQPTIYLGSLLTDFPKIQYDLGSEAYFEANIAREKHLPAQEINARYTLARMYIKQALVREKFLREKGETQKCLTHEESCFARFWMAQLLTDGLGGERNTAQAKQLCNDLLQSGFKPPHQLEFWIQELLQRITDESTTAQQ